MTQHRGRRTNGGSTGARAQTLHDYIAGISVFVLTLAVVLGLLPSVLAPFQSEAGAADATQAGRISDRLVTNLSVAGAPNVLNATELSAVMERDDSELRTRYGLASHRHVNLTLSSLNGSIVLTNATGTPLTGGGTLEGEGAVSAARIVSLDNRTYGCTPACRLVVRVW